ncbi:MAG: hypothetical protein J7L77_07335, partial [Clostridiales bacterium]|nr:hypothetical protein [Clostridiales bacterium]
MLRRDFVRQPTLRKKVFALFFNSGVQALILHRLAAFLYGKGFFFNVLSIMVYRFNIFFTGADIWPEASIGSAVLFPHATGIVIGGSA